MRVMQTAADLESVPGPVVLAIGVFDGVHLGHRAVIERATTDARRFGGNAVVVSFDPHPMRVLRPDKAPRLLTSTGHKIRLIRSLGVEHLLMLHFDAALASTPPEVFIHTLHAHARPLREICVGHEWSFGRNRAGNLALLRRMGDELGFDEVGVPAVKIGGEIVSSTLIRRAVQTGDLKRAATLLGREYTILGTVVEGDHLGRRLGFPTANLSAHSEQFPPDGVYAVEARHRGEMIPGVVNIGVRPTVKAAGGQRLLELHLFDFDREIYGEEIEVFFRRFLRSEIRFPDVASLQAQIGRDAAEARAALAGKADAC
jgi:riboflavin kinase/FMN adenylyltransferase